MGLTIVPSYYKSYYKEKPRSRFDHFDQKAFINFENLTRDVLFQVY